MAIRRPLVLDGGMQKQVRDADILDVASGIEARNWKADGSYETVKMSIGHADNLLLADGADPASNHIEFLGSTKFNKDVLIQGELRVVGDSFAVDTMVTQTIFEQSVQFGDGAIDGTNAQDKAEFAASIQMHTGHLEGAFLKTSAGPLALDAENALLDMDGQSVELRSDSTLQIDSADASHLKMVANEELEKVLTIRAENSHAGGSGKLDMSADGKVEIDGGNTSHFKTSAGDLDLEGQVNLQARAETGFLEVLAGPASAPATMMNNGGVGAGDVAIAASSDVGVHAGASIDMDAATDVLANAGGKVEIVASDFSKFQVTDPAKMLTLQADGLGSVVLLDAPTGSVLGQAGSLVKMTAGDPNAANLNDIKGELRISAGDASHLWSYKDFDLKLESRGTGNLLADSGDKMILRAGDYSDQANFEALLAGKELAMSAEGKAYLRSDLSIEALAPAINESASDGNFVMLASTQAVTAAPIATPATLGQMHLASAALMQLDSKAAIQLDADAASHFKTSAGSLTLESTAAHVLTKAATFFSSISTINGLNKPSVVFGGPNASLAASGISDDTGAHLLLGEDFASVLKSQDEQDLEVKSKRKDISIAAGEDAQYDNGAKVAHGGDVTITAKGWIEEGTDSGDGTPDRNGGNILIQSQGMHFAGATSFHANAEGFLTLDAANELRLHPGYDSTNSASKHVIVMKSDGTAPDLDDPADAVARIRNVKDPEKDQDVVTKKYMEENGGGTAKLTIAAAEVATMAVGDLVSLNSSGEIIQASGKSTEAANGRHYAVGFVTKIENTNQALVRMLGKYELPAAHGVTAGQPVYMAADVFTAGSAGNVTATAPSDEGDMVQRVGFSLGGSLILVAIGEPVLL